jgi:hypothetical protein
VKLFTARLQLSDHTCYAPAHLRTFVPLPSYTLTNICLPRFVDDFSFSNNNNNNNLKPDEHFEMDLPSQQPRTRHCPAPHLMIVPALSEELGSAHRPPQVPRMFECLSCLCSGLCYLHIQLGVTSTFRKYCP